MPPEKLDASIQIHAIASIFPNPAFVEANVSVEYPENELNVSTNPNDSYQVTVTNLSGTILWNSLQIEDKFSIDLSDFPKGVLLLKMVGKENTFTNIIIKQ